MKTCRADFIGVFSVVKLVVAWLQWLIANEDGRAKSGVPCVIGTMVLLVRKLHDFLERSTKKINYLI